MHQVYAAAVVAVFEMLDALAGEHGAADRPSADLTPREGAFVIGWGDGRRRRAYHREMALSHRSCSALAFLVAFVAGCKTSAPVGDAPATTKNMEPSDKPAPADLPATSASPPLPSGTPASASAPAATPGDADRAADAAGERAFAVKLHGVLTKAGASDTNLFVSPASIRFAFGMLHAGAKGETATELEGVFGFSSKTADVASFVGSEWERMGKPAKEEWRKGEEVTIRSANRVFAGKTVNLVPAYASLTRDRYRAPVELLDFGGDPDGSRVRINKWVEDNTSGKIKDILAPRSITKDTRIALANAIYFKAPWESAFEVSDTKPGPFTTPKGKVQVPMMTHLGHGKVGDTSEAEVVEVPYTRGFTMTIVLPKGQGTLAGLEQAMTADKLQQWFRAPSHVPKLRVAMPKFRVESTLPLGDAMQALGVKKAFVYGQADFSGVDGTKELFVGAAIHKTFVAVDEKGTEAAAATVVSMAAGAAPDQSKPREVNVDRPFLFAIRDVARDRLLFLGRVVDPTK